MADTQHHILIIDDDLYIRDLYEEVLTSAGFVVDIAKDGKEGYEKITTNAYSLILLDVMLPQLDGIGILTQLKETKKKHAPIILMTNLSRDPVLKEAAALGVETCLIKADINPDQLLATVQQTLGLAVTSADPNAGAPAPAILAEPGKPVSPPVAPTPPAPPAPSAAPEQTSQSEKQPKEPAQETSQAPAKAKTEEPEEESKPKIQSEDL